MKTPFALTALLLLALAPPAQAADVTVTLDVDVAGVDHKTCDVTVPAGADGGDVLDAAVASGCLLLWTYQEYPGFGRYVDCIDVVCGAIATYWAFYVNGAYSDYGIDDYRAQQGDVVGFNYEQWVVPA